METLRQFNNRYKRQAESWSQKRDELSEEIKRLEEKKEKVAFPEFVGLFMPIAEKVKQRLKADAIESYGPFGLCSERSFYWKKGKRTLGSICFISHDGGWALRNDKKVTGAFPERSIGAMNGMNNETVLITPQMDITWITRWARGQR